MSRGYAALALALVALAGRAGADDRVIPVSASCAGKGCAPCAAPKACAPVAAPCRPCGRGLLEQIRDWFTYRPCPVPCQCTCWAPKIHICYPPLYTFFLYDRGERCKKPCTDCCPAPGRCAAARCTGGCAGEACQSPAPR